MVLLKSWKCFFETRSRCSVCQWSQDWGGNSAKWKMTESSHAINFLPGENFNQLYLQIEVYQTISGQRSYLTFWFLEMSNTTQFQPTSIQESFEKLEWKPSFEESSQSPLKLRHILSRILLHLSSFKTLPRLLLDPLNKAYPPPPPPDQAKESLRTHKDL